MVRTAPGPVLIMAGGTGGHIFPGLAVADSLRERGLAVRWLGARGAMETQKVPPHGIPLDVVDIRGLRGKGAAGWLQAPFKLLRAVRQASKVFKTERPACAISFGGYAAGPGGLAARLRGVPLLVHEQNRIPGMTNRVLSRFAARVLQAFPGTWDEARKPLTCGNPVRRDVVALPPPAERLAGREGPVRLLVTGGSQGAVALNRLVPAALARLPEGTAFEVRHQCGRGRVEDTQAAYDSAGLSCPVGPASAGKRNAVATGFPAEAGPTQVGDGVAAGFPAEAGPTGAQNNRVVEVTEFIDDMAAAYAWADLVICRAGALTVSEIAAAGLPALFVPFPHAVDDHQTRNAEFLVERGAARLLPESGANPETLAALLAELFADAAVRRDMAERAREASVPDAADRVAALCAEYVAPGPQPDPNPDTKMKEAA